MKRSKSQQTITGFFNKTKKIEQEHATQSRSEKICESELTKQTDRPKPGSTDTSIDLGPGPSTSLVHLPEQ